MKLQGHVGVLLLRKNKKRLRRNCIDIYLPPKHHTEITFLDAVQETDFGPTPSARMRELHCSDLKNLIFHLVSPASVLAYAAPSPPQPEPL